MAKYSSSLVLSKRISGKYIDVQVYTLRGDGRKFLEGKMRCPFTGKEFTLNVVPHLDQPRLGFVQLDGGLVDHIRRVDKYGEWLYERIDSYSRSSFHRRKYFVCRQCQHKTDRFIDILLHLAIAHGFLVSKP